MIIYADTSYDGKLNFNEIISKLSKERATNYNDWFYIYETFKRNNASNLYKIYLDIDNLITNWSILSSDYEANKHEITSNSIWWGGNRYSAQTDYYGSSFSKKYVMIIIVSTY